MFCSVLFCCVRPSSLADIQAVVFGNCEEELPKKPVGRLSVTHRMLIELLEHK